MICDNCEKTVDRVEYCAWHDMHICWLCHRGYEKFL